MSEANPTMIECTTSYLAKQLHAMTQAGISITDAVMQRNVAQGNAADTGIFPSDVEHEILGSIVMQCVMIERIVIWLQTLPATVDKPMGVIDLNAEMNDIENLQSKIDKACPENSNVH